MRYENLWLLLLCGSVLLASSRAQSVFQYCDNQFNLSPGYSTLESPYYPSYYPAGSACRYQLKAPVDYTIQATCSIETDKSTSSCTTENIYISVDGDAQLRSSENFCGAGTATRTSLFNQLTLAYISQGSWGKFRCQLYVAPQPCDCGWSAVSRIVNGEQATINEFPFMVALADKTSTGRFYCGGTIISHRFIMSAAHCAVIQSNPANVQALVGDHDLSTNTESRYAARYDILQIIAHPNYVADPQVQNDIALFRTVVDIQWSRGVGPICLPAANYDSTFFEYKDVQLAGWGTTSFGGATSPVLKKAAVYVIDRDYCQSQYSPLAVINNLQMCTASVNGRDACQYDSGGPAIYRTSRAFQAGIISFGKYCGVGSPAIGVNTRVNAYLPWITQITGGLCSKAF